MAAHQSSSLSSSAASSYEVFLSFHGMDVRKNFADHLYTALDDAGIRTYRDEDELQKGNKIWPEICAAIRQSRISIPIFSKNYASSKWCLHELTEISECKRTMDQIVFPIFYKVEPRDVRNQRGTYAEAFEEHQMRFDETIVQKWREDLKEVGKLDGWPSKEDTHEAELVKDVVKTVWSTLNKRPLNVSDNLVGIQSHIKEMLMLLDIESNNRKIVGIHGIGGIGKTTIARTVYNIVFHHFEGYSFIENIQENAQKHGLPHLQNQLIFDILKQENRNITSVDDGINVIRQRFCQRKVLIVLDDVDQNIQVESLVGNRKWFGIGSKIIITSRNKDILHAQEADAIYEPKVMDLDDSLQLFSHHAFRRDQPLEDYRGLSKAMVKTTGGLPLALQVIGSSLFFKEKSVWEGMLKKLQKVPNDDVMKRLEISYDGLDDEQKQMFLDIACFFIGMKKDIACHIWDGCGFSSPVGLDALYVRSLITISEEGVLRMHDQLRDLGRKIVCQESIDEPGKRTRIWSQEDVLEVLDRQTGTSNVKGLSCIEFSGRSRSECLMSEGFVAMTKLRFLQLDYVHFADNLFAHSFSELRWLSWKGCPDNQYVQSNFCPWKLVVLDLFGSAITENWMGWNCIKMAVNLKVLILTSCYRLSRTPDLSANRHLEILNLKNCTALVEIDTSICYLRKLVILDMSGCWILLDLPIEICGLSSLQRLDLTGCKSLIKLPDKLDCMISLTRLDLGGCDKIESLPILSSLKDLNELCLEGCTKLLHISNLPLSLTKLDVRLCSSIRYISSLPSSLSKLDVAGCKSMKKLSSTAGLRNLERLCLVGCNSLEEIEGVGEGLDSLVLFTISSCPLKKLPKLTGLKKFRKLKLDHTNFISDIGCLEEFESLEKLTIIEAPSLKMLPDVSPLKSLSYLKISRCYSMERLPDLSNLNKLQILRIENCSKLTEIPGLVRLESLRELKIKGCLDIAIERLPDMSNLKNLNDLKIEGCWNLTEIHGIDGLKFLKILHISWCLSLERLPDLSSLKNLNDLKINGCRNLNEIHGLDRLEILEKLDISWCPSLARLPNLSNLKNLKELRANGCKMLTEIQASNGLESLEILDIRGCLSLEKIPNLKNLKEFWNLDGEDCSAQPRLRATDGGFTELQLYLMIYHMLLGGSSTLMRC